MLKKLFLLLPTLAVLLGCHVSDAQVTRILYVGDSWTHYPWALQDPPALRAVLARPDIGLGNYIEDGSIALAQPTASGWNTPQYRDLIVQKLAENPTIDIVHISLGGNDLNLGIGGNFSSSHIENLNSTTAGHIEQLIDLILQQRPDIRVAVCGYDYLNITEGVRYNQFFIVQSIEAPTAVAYALLGLSALMVQDVLNNQKTVNNVFIDLEQRKLNACQARSRTRYIHNFGLMQAVYGIPSLGIAATAPAGVPVGAAGNYSNFPGGNRDLFTPRQALDGSTDLDPIHLSDGGYLRLMENAVAQAYFAWLKDSTAPEISRIDVLTNKEATSGHLDFEVVFTESVTGVDVGDFEVLATGVESAAVESVSGSGAVYTVRVAHGGGIGTVRLDVIDDDTIYDAVWNPLGKKNFVHVEGDGEYRDGPLAVVGSTPEGEPVPEGEPECIAPEKSPRVLIVGDSWAAGMYLSGALDEVMDEYGLTHVGIAGAETAIGGSKADQWATSQWRGKITQALLDYPTIDTIHLSIGGNDILSNIKATDAFEGVGALLREGWWNAIEDDIQEIVDHCLVFPQIRKVVLADYDYLNRVTAQLFYSLTGGSNDFGGMTQFEVNECFVAVGERKKAIAARTPGCEYIHNFGLLQHAYQSPNWAARPGSAATNFLPYHGGDQTLPMPDSAFDPFDILGVVIPGDGIHPNVAAHKVLLRNAVDEVYYDLYAPELICPEEGEPAEGASEGSAEGVAEGLVEGLVEGGSEGAIEGTTEGDIEGSLEGSSEGVSEGVLEGAVEGGEEGAAEGEVEGTVEGTSEGVLEGSLEGAVEGAEEGSVEGTFEGLSEGFAEGISEGGAEGATEGFIEGSFEGGHEGIEEGVSEGQFEGAQEGSSEGTPEGSVEGLTEGAAEGLEETTHTADLNGNSRIDLSELLRLIQFYNFRDGFGCGDGEDGFDLGSLLRECDYHATDYAEPRWLITLSELLRAVQMFNLGEYWFCPEAEDGFCAGQKPVS
ncbi:MAG: hypothetical protein RLZZ303_1569 [Candidatus Hydrogenedentota bacterium]